MCLKTIRLNSFISKKFNKTDREARNLITNGCVTVDGVFQKEAGYRLRPEAKVEINDVDPQYTYYAVNKPCGILSFPNQKGEKSVYSYLPEVPKVFNIGRLDQDSSGLIIFTDNGKLTQLLMNSNSSCLPVEKEYTVQVERDISDLLLDKLRYGVDVLGSFSRPKGIDRVSSNTFNIILEEGKNRQIRRMCRSIGHHVKSLHRFRIGKYLLPSSLLKGQYVSLTSVEVGMICHPNEFRN
jgi:23S rRNA pseudouridine2604 synthase